MLMKMRSKMERTKNQKGFTLVELMVVVVILGVLVAIAVPIYNNVTLTSKTKACAANIRTINGAIEMAKANGVAADDIDNEELTGGYVKNWPTCPISGGAAYTVTKGVLNETDHFAVAGVYTTHL